MGLGVSQLKRLGSSLMTYRADHGGAAAAEFALVLGFLLIPLLNAMDFGIYIYQAMELNGAAQAAAEAALVTCGGNVNTLPATQNCKALLSAMTTAAQSTSLGSAVAISSPSENYYCTDSSGVLVQVGNISTGDQPVDCSAVVPGSTDAPGDYVLITASFTYNPVFPAASLASLLTTPITKTVWMRLA
jgi:Flp pilus assembly protein TadG